MHIIFYLSRSGSGSGVVYSVLYVYVCAVLLAVPGVLSCLSC